VTPRPSRRRFLAAVGASSGSFGLAGCLGGGLPGDGDGPDRIVYVGAYHWGFLLLDETGAEHERLVLDPGTTVGIVAFNTSAEGTIAQLPGSVREAVPDHESLEERNEERIPTPPDGELHEALDEANERYPDHSLAVVPSGYNHMGGMGGPNGGGMWGPNGGGMWGPNGGGMMLRPIPLPHDAPRPTTAGMVATTRGDYTLSCTTYCGWGHPYMDLDGAFVVR